MPKCTYCLFMILILFVVSCQTKSKPEIRVIDDALTFYVVGDWGRNGHAYQQDVADMMNACGAIIEPEFIVSTGDNFYQNGVASIDDPLWISSFENVYQGEHLLEYWYPVLGNHDYHGNVQAQIDYSKKSQRWKLPARYYVVDHALENDTDTLKLIFIDSNPFEDKYYHEAGYENVWSQDTTAQLHWLDSVITTSTATWNIVIGHHPMYTAGKRSDEENTIRRHLAHHLLKDGKVTAYFAGHEHDLQYHKPEGTLHHFVSGAGSEVRPVGNKLPFTKFAESTPGFMSVSVLPEAITVQIISSTGINLHTATITH